MTKKQILTADNPRDIRDAGWCLAIHKDFQLDGKFRTSWLFTKDDRAVRGEGGSDAEALNAVRLKLNLPVTQEAPTAEDNSLDRPWKTEGHGHFEYIETICDAYESGMGDGLNGKLLHNPYNYRANPDQHAAFEAGHTLGTTRRAEQPAPVAPVTQSATYDHVTDNDRTMLSIGIDQLEGLASGTIMALGGDHLLKKTSPKKATIADVKRMLPFIISNLKRLRQRLDYLPTDAQSQ